MTSRSGQWSRWRATGTRDVPRVLHPHRVHGVEAGHLHVLDRGLEDDGRPELLGGGEDGLHREVVDDVDRRDAVPLGERAGEDLAGRNDRHATPPSVGTRCWLDASSSIAVRLPETVPADHLLLRGRPAAARDRRSSGRPARRGRGRHVRVALVDDEHVDDPGAEHAEDRQRLLGLADDGDDRLDAVQVVDGEGDQATAVGRRDQPPVDVDVVAEDVADRALALGAGRSPRGRGSRCGPSCSRRRRCRCRRGRRRPGRLRRACARPPPARGGGRASSRVLDVGRRVEAPRRAPRSPRRGRGRSRSGWSGCPRAASRPWRSRTRSRAAAAGRKKRGTSPVSRPWPTATTSPSRRRRSRNCAALRATASRCDWGSGAARSHDGVGEPELLPEACLQVEVEPGRRRDPDVHDAGPAGPLQQPLHLRAGEPELARRSPPGSARRCSSGGRSARGARSLPG